MRIVGITLGLVMAGVLANTAAYAAEATGGKIKAGVIKKGTLRSGIVTVAPNSSAAVINVPDDEVFVLTQACISGEGPAGEGPALVSQALGRIAVPLSCTSYSPGIVLPEEDVLDCVGAPFGGGTCMVTGVLTRNRPRR